MSGWTDQTTGVRPLVLAIAIAATVCMGAPADEVTLANAGAGSGTYRWLDTADQPYSDVFRTDYTYDDATVIVTYTAVAPILSGTLSAAGLKPNFTYQLKLAGEPGTTANERIGLAGRWWQEEWNGTGWSGGRNLNDKGDGSSPNPNDLVYFARRDVVDPDSPSGLHYRFTGYLVLGYFITDGDGSVQHPFQADSSYHVLWKTTQRPHTPDDGPLLTTVFDADDSAAYADTGGDDFPVQSASVFGEWERLPVGGVYLQPGAFTARVTLTEESFHGSGGPLSGLWAAAVDGEIVFTIAPETLSAALTCLPFSGTVPFTSVFTVTLSNTSAHVRTAAARISVSTAGGSAFSNWRSGYTNLDESEVFTTAWSQSIPALGSVIGDNVFTLEAEDVTPAPFNHPPNPPAGDTDASVCTVTGSAP